MPAIALTKTLIICPSVTPNDAGCQAMLSERLSALGFRIETLRFNDVDNLVAIYGTNGPLWMFLGHTDVVPPGDLTAWDSPPFSPTLRDDHLYGRGAADMKSAIAAMVVACERVFSQPRTIQGQFAILLTSDEEGDGIDGTKRVIETLIARDMTISGCIVGEPTSTDITGDVIKVGRRGSLSGTLVIYGKQGHIAYPSLANNPIPLALPALQTLIDKTWDQGNDHFSPTQFQISNLHAGVGVTNVIPGTVTIDFNLRYSPESNAESLIQQIECTLKEHKLTYDITWTHSAIPFYTSSGYLLDTCMRAITTVQSITPALSTSGGTSDGRFLAPYGIDVIELGVPNTTIHQANECVSVKAIEALTNIYEEILRRLLKM